MHYIHGQGLLHRDLSLQNVLLKVFRSAAVLVKLSDFGLVKESQSDFTRSKTEMRGTILDPQLANFKDYDISNEVYAIGWILQHIFTGKESLPSDDGEVSRIVRKCTASDIAQRYPAVRSIIADVEPLDAAPTGAPA
jgi:serine/threonine protein kinase